DCLVHTARTEAHTLCGGPDGLEVLAFGERHRASGARLPRAGVSWGLGSWVRTGAEDEHPWKLEAEAGEPEVGPSTGRPAWVVNAADVEPEPFGRGSVESAARDLGMVGGSVRTGLNLVTVPEGKLNVPPHCHSVEEEIFVVLKGEGQVELARTPAAWADAVTGTFPVRAGSTVARPAGTRVAPSFGAGAGGLTLLSYGTRDAGDIAYYPRSNKVNFRGIGLMTRLERLDYWDGED
ncbi:MAG: cupin domain-containing protein, partial [Actinobacteria bacterium]|nr:cupin domain-containing protein [Actinomycetota bacterium]